jgi:hypothetical protein
VGTVLEMKNLFLTCALAAMALTGCGNDPESFAGARLVKSAITDGASSLKRSAEPAAKLAIKRSDLDAISTPAQLVTLQNGKQGLVGLLQNNRGVTTWSTVDDVTISLRDGVIAATRGLGDDLMAAVPVSPNQLASGAKSYQRTLTHLDGIDQAIATTFTCNASIDGRQQIEIVQLSYSTTHVVESCSSASTSFQNDYWIGAAGIRKSRQWVSENAGYLTIEDLRR